MREAEIVETAIVWSMCGALVMLFILVKLGGGPALLGDQEATLQMHMAEVEVDHATGDAQHPSPLRSRAPASKSDILE